MRLASDTRLRSKYEAFLSEKGRLPNVNGITDMSVSSVLFDWQSLLTEWALHKGRAALFCDTGLGKTLMQLEWARNIPGSVLIVSPLAVAWQTLNEATKLGIDDIEYSRNPEVAQTQIVITNYEQVHKFNPAHYRGVVLDESSILKSVEGKTRTQLIQQFHQTPWRLACTATPAPNDIAEFANHAEFLGVCTREEMLSMFFVHDDTGWRLKGHARDAFYAWMATWSVTLRHPLEIGYPDERFTLPPLNTQVEWVDAQADQVAQEQGALFFMGLDGIVGRGAARKVTIASKVDRVAQIVNDSNESFLIWHWLNEEGYQLQRVIPNAELIEGRQSNDMKESSLMRFVTGQTRVLITKPSIAGFGLNLQHCANVVFMGLTDSWETYYQAVRRCWRFGQTRPVNNYIVISDLERPIFENIERKERQHQETALALSEHLSQFQRSELGIETVSHSGYHPNRTEGEGYTLHLGDCIEGLAALSPESVDFSVFSPPFMSLYTYSNSERDLGNSHSEQEFFKHFAFVVEGLMRVLKPGRLLVCHVAQVPAKLVSDGFIGLKDFRGKTISAFIEKGFVFHGEVVIDKNPQAQAIRTHAKGLLFKQLKSDASWLRPGLADYLLVFRKLGENAVPIHPDIDNEEWIKWAHPIWYDIRETDTLNVAEGRDEPDERHIAPLQLGVIERCVRLWSNPGEIVLSPFAGIGSEGYGAILLNRRFIGMELKESYYRTAIRNLERAVERTKQGRLL
tara:strand:- start:21256 stop:23469 length:2214 start_codon:yes stop_codon:yes gene_type:complete